MYLDAIHATVENDHFGTPERAAYAKALGKAGASWSEAVALHSASAAAWQYPHGALHEEEVALEHGAADTTDDSIIEL
eukprot:516847-Prymnesium_polylepis.1